MAFTITASQRRKLKSIAQRLEAQVKLGKNGVSEAFLKQLNEALDAHELVKVRFVEFKEDKKTLAPGIADQAGCAFVTRVGNVAVYYRQQEDPERRKIRVD